MDASPSDVRAHLLSVARELFYCKGYQRVTMRAIATDSAMSLGNIYNYFPTKAELFEAVLAPVLRAMDVLDDQCINLDPTAEDWFSTAIPMLMGAFTQFVRRYRKELYILFYGAQGSRFANYRDEFIEERLRAGMTFNEHFARLHPEIEMVHSELFYRVRCAEWYEMLRLFVMSGDLTKEEQESFIRHYARFTSAGWQALLVSRGQ